MRFVLTLFIMTIISLAAAGQETIDRSCFGFVKAGYKDAGQINMDIGLVVESKVFDDVDSIGAQVTVVADGRYRADIGDDIYMFDGRDIWEYSAENNQATVRSLKDGEQYDNRLIFLTDFDKCFETREILPDSIYALYRRPDTDRALPDSMVAYINCPEATIFRLEYHDTNGDLNRIHFLSVTLTDTISSGLFDIGLPDSVEIITLP